MRTLVPIVALAISGLLLLMVLMRPEPGVPPAPGTAIAPSPLLGQVAPPLMPDTDATAASPFGNPMIELAGAQGVTVVNFWASWCPPCRAEHPTLLRLAESGVRVIGVNIDDEPGAARDYIDGAGNPFAAIVFDPKLRVAAGWGVTAPPQSFIIDAEGRVAAAFRGALIGSDFEQRFVPALKAAGWRGEISR